jgi:YggT family protein
MLFVSGNSLPAFGAILTWSIAGLISMVLNIYFWALIISIIASFIAPFSGHPALVLLRQLTEPAMAPFRRILPPMGGLDLSPIFIFLAIQILRTLLVLPLNAPGFVPGL